MTNLALLVGLVLVVVINVIARHVSMTSEEKEIFEAEKQIYSF